MFEESELLLEVGSHLACFEARLKIRRKLVHLVQHLHIHMMCLAVLEPLRYVLAKDIVVLWRHFLEETYDVENRDEDLFRSLLVADLGENVEQDRHQFLGVEDDG